MKLIYIFIIIFLFFILKKISRINFNFKNSNTTDYKTCEITPDEITPDEINCEITPDEINCEINDEINCEITPDEINNQINDETLVSSTDSENLEKVESVLEKTVQKSIPQTQRRKSISDDNINYQEIPIVENVIHSLTDSLKGLKNYKRRKTELSKIFEWKDEYNNRLFIYVDLNRVVKFSYNGETPVSACGEYSENGFLVKVNGNQYQLYITLSMLQYQCGTLIQNNIKSQRFYLYVKEHLILPVKSFELKSFEFNKFQNELKLLKKYIPCKPWKFSSDANVCIEFKCEILYLKLWYEKEFITNNNNNAIKMIEIFVNKKYKNCHKLVEIINTLYQKGNKFTRSLAYDEKLRRLRSVGCAKELYNFDYNWWGIGIHSKEDIVVNIMAFGENKIAQNNINIKKPCSLGGKIYIKDFMDQDVIWKCTECNYQHLTKEKKTFKNDTFFKKLSSYLT